MLEFEVTNSTSSRGDTVTSGGIDFPVSDAADSLLLFVSYIQPSGLSASISTPTGATPVGSATALAVFSFAGGSTGSASFTFSTNPCSFTAWMVRVKYQKSTSPYSAASTATASGLSHLINASSGAPYANAVFIAAIAATTMPSGGVGFDAAESITDFDGNRLWNSDDFSIPDTVLSALNVAYKVAAAASDGKSLTWSSLGTQFPFPTSASSSMVGFWVSPSQAPSAPTVTAPATNGKFTVGSTQRIQWTPATDPNIAAASLTYKVYASGNGITYTLLTTTSAGVLYYDWNTAGSSPGNWTIKVVANNGTDDGAPGYSGTFALYADVAPGAPSELSPTGYISQDARDFTWTGNYPDFDTQKAYKLDYSSSADMSSPTSTGKITSTAALKSWAASSGILASTGQKYWRVATYGNVDDTQGEWSAPVPVYVAAKPATPTITSSSTATSAAWTVTFTGIAHSSFRHRWVLSGDVRFNQVITSSAFSFAAPFNLATGQVWDVYVSVIDPVTGLESAEAHQTLTVTYTGPAKPTLTLTVINALGAVQCEIDDADTCDHFRLYRYKTSEGASTAILISPKIGQSAKKATFLDSQIESDAEYSYYARAFKVTTLGFTDSDVETATASFTNLFLHIVTKTSATGNAGLSTSVMISGGEVIERINKKQRSEGHSGRDKMLTYAGQSVYTELVFDCLIPRTDTATFEVLQSIFNALKGKTVACFRDQHGHKIFGKFLELPKIDSRTDVRFSLRAIEENHKEEFAR
jgi:hypothetical protein